jgi:tRNA (guanine-N7-)-methyltransferase
VTRGPRLLPDPPSPELSALTTPPDWTQVFGFDGALELEIGSGKGGHAVEYALRHPGVRYVAIEWRRKYVRDTADRAAKLGLGNLRAVEGDARALVPRLFRPGTLDWVRLQFPDPWWKRAQQKRAIIRGDFVTLLFDLLRPGGQFDLRTDVEDRGQRMLRELEAVGFLNPLGPLSFHPWDPEEVPSSRERRYLVTGQPVYRARLRKPSGAGVQPAGNLADNPGA